MLGLLDRTDQKKKHKGRERASGWSLPLKDKDAPETYSEVLLALRNFYKPANEELYRLMEAMGPTTGWTGRFLDSSS
jgi:hypothetical protein